MTCDEHRGHGRSSACVGEFPLWLSQLRLKRTCSVEEDKSRSRTILFRQYPFIQMGFFVQCVICIWPLGSARSLSFSSFKWCGSLLYLVHSLLQDFVDSYFSQRKWNSLVPNRSVFIKSFWPEVKINFRENYIVHVLKHSRAWGKGGRFVGNACQTFLSIFLSHIFGFLF